MAALSIRHTRSHKGGTAHHNERWNMSGRQHVDDAHFKKFNDAMQQASSQFEADYKTLIDTLQRLEGGKHWKGAAMTAFQNAHAVLSEEHTKVNQKIRHINEAVVRTHRTAGATDQEIEASLKSVDVGGGGSSGIDSFSR